MAVAKTDLHGYEREGVYEAEINFTTHLQLFSLHLNRSSKSVCDILKVKIGLKIKPNTIVYSESRRDYNSKITQTVRSK